MTDSMGFWTIARESPEKLCLVDPEGVEVTYGELLERSNRLVHGLRALGLQPGDGVAVVLPNSTEFYALFFAAMQAGWYFTPINHHLVGPEIAYIVDDCEAKALVVDARFAEPCTVAAKEIALPPDRRFAIGDVDGFRPFDELTDGQPTTAAGGPHGRAPHALHLGHHRQAEGRAPDADAGRPRRRPVTSPGSSCSLFGIQPARRQRPHLRLAAVPHGRPAVLVLVDPPGPPGRAHGQVDAGVDAAADPATTG